MASKYTLLYREQNNSIEEDFISSWVHQLTTHCSDTSLINYLYSCIDSELTRKGEILWSEYDALSEIHQIVARKLYQCDCTEEYEFLDDLKNSLDTRLTTISNEFDLADDED